MRSRIFLLLVVLSVCLTARAQTVNEKDVQIVLGGEVSKVILPVTSASDQPQTKVRIEMVDTNDAVTIFAEETRSLVKGSNLIEIPIAMADVVKQSYFRYYRLRYSVGDTTGLISLARTASDIFDLEAFSFDYPQSNSRYMVRVRAIHPVTLKGVGGVSLDGKLYLDQVQTDRKEISVLTTTDQDGFAVLDFQLHEGSRINNFYLTINGSKRGFTNGITKWLPSYSFNRYSYLYFQTDKPIYQPGQMLRVRSLLFDDKRKAITDDTLVFTIKDSEETVISKTELKTSRFGVAALEWQIPENAKLGEYTITVTSDRNLDRSSKNFTISRYDLPNFSVSAQSDRKYYLPDQKMASVKVTADYLFGKPVINGKVRVVEETDRNWNSKLQKYEIEEGEVREGVLDETGTFTAEFDLTDAHEDFEEEYGERFEDKHYVAYVTDLTTNRTEQRRFDVRITDQALHLYLLGEDETHYSVSKRLPGRFYLTAFYPDGSPAACDFSIYQAHEDSDEDDPKAGKLLVKGKTNLLGAARPSLFLDIKDEDGDDEDELELVIKAKDRAGNKGVETSDLDFDLDKPAVQITTDKIVYKKGEPIKISVISSDKEATLFLSVMRKTEVVLNEKIRLNNGKAELTLPFADSLKGPLRIAAYGTYRSENGFAQSFGANRSVIFPVIEGMQVTASSSKNVYRPGEEAVFELAANKAEGGAEESVFGISVIDKAIDERARTDSDFGGNYRSFYSDFEEILGLSGGPGGLPTAGLNAIDPEKPISPEAELALEIALRSRFYPNLQESGSFVYGQKEIYKYAFDVQLKDIRTSLQKLYNEQSLTATDEASLRKMLTTEGIDLDKRRDPWGNQYRYSVLQWKENSEIKITSNGPDEIEETRDDMIAYEGKFPYFNATAKMIDQAIRGYERRTERFIQEYKTLRDELKLQNFDLDSLRDKWGRPYKFQFGVENSLYFVKVISGGWDKKIGGYDDFTVWTHYTDYFRAARANMAEGLRKYVRENGKFPENEGEIMAMVKQSGYDLNTMKDAFGRTYYITKETRSRYANRRVVRNYTGTKVTPVSQDMIVYSIRSNGSDGIKGNADDFELTRFAGIVSEKTPDGKVNNDVKAIPSSYILLGGVMGTVTDPNGALVPGAVVKAHSIHGQFVLETLSDQAGEFIISDLPTGHYNIRIESPGFKVTVIQAVYIESQTITEVKATLEVGAVSNTVEVTASAEIDQNSNVSGSRISTEFFSNIPTSRSVQGLYMIAPTAARSGLRDASVAGSSGPENNYVLDGVNSNARVNAVTKSGTSPEQGKTREQIETPRLREYFPETLAWFPELLSNPDGKASFKFKLGDNLTTWKVAVIGSTANGDIAITEKEIKTFQPFFVDLDPPKFLTNGDEISLPVQVRNYTNKKQSVGVTMTRSDWFSFLGADSQRIDVDPARSQNAVFGFKAAAAIKNGKQKVTAIGSDDSDAIEKPVTVRPDGEEIVKPSSQLFSGSATFDINFPANALAKTQKAHLKVYPNLMSHVAESVEGLLKRPYGCGEQTISSTYPNLMILKFVADETNLKKTARKYLKDGYERLTGYQVEDGGFSYWGGKDKSDLALTAYALRFLSDAKEFIAVDEEVVKKANDWLIKQQKTDGSWANPRHYSSSDDTRGTLLFTAYVTRTLAMRKEKDDAARGKALTYLKARSGEINEPYALALYGLTMLNAGDAEAVRPIVAKLENMAISEGPGAYWNLESNTPFNGWGTTGRLETTALVLQFLIRHGQVGENKAAAASGLIGKATIFLLKNKDQYGVWYSTQTTINVLDAFLAALTPVKNGSGDTLQVTINGRSLPEINVPANQIEPVQIDIADELDPVTNKIEVRSAISRALMAQVVATHYIDWRDSESTGRTVNQSRTLKLDYGCDKTSTAIMQEVTCAVNTERIGFQGYGMLLAEIGTPPGADVSRESLQAAMDADWSISRYDVLPDRIVVYMWAKAGGTKFNFKFKPRYGINAQTPASTAYDYYNPESKAVAAPVRFVVK